jgi:hypothetical protein
MEVSGFISCSGHFTPEEGTQYPLDRRLFGSLICCGHFGEEKNPTLLGIKL